MTTIILALVAACGSFALSRFAFHVGIGWSVFWGVFGLFLFLIVVSRLIKRRFDGVMTRVQSIMLAGQKQIEKKVQIWQVRPLGSIQEMQRKVMEDTAVFVRQAIAEIDAMAKYRLWVPMIDRQIATAKLSLSWMIRDFKTVDALLPKAFLLDPTLVAIKMARLYMTGGDMAEIQKLYRKGVRRVRYNGNVLLAATMSWMQVRKGDADGAFKTLTEALEKSDDATLKQNHNNLMNNRIAHFNNSGLGDKWYSLWLEEPRIRMQRPRQAYR